MRGRSVSLLGLACLAMVLGGCGLTGTSTRSVSTGPPPTADPQANAPLTPSWQTACGPASMMNQGVQSTGMEPAYSGPCTNEPPGQQAAKNMATVVAQLKPDQSALGMRPGADMDLVAFGDYMGPSVCFTVQPTATSYSAGSMPAMSQMSCVSSIEFPARWVQSVVGNCKVGACANTVFAVCATQPCKLGRVGFMLRPKPPAGPG